MVQYTITQNNIIQYNTCCPVLPLPVFHSPAAAVCEFAAHRRQKKRMSWPAAKMQETANSSRSSDIRFNFYLQNSPALQQTLVLKTQKAVRLARTVEQNGQERPESLDVVSALSTQGRKNGSSSSLLKIKP